MSLECIPRVIECFKAQSLNVCKICHFSLKGEILSTKSGKQKKVRRS